jgi:hypothetical protein
MRMRLTVLAFVAALAGFGTIAAAAEDAQQVHGHLTSEAVTGSACTSPVGLCTAGRLDGVINGDFAFTAHSLQPTETANVFFYTGDIVVHTSRGDLRCTDAGAYDFASGGVVDLCTMTGGTGDWVGVQGHLRIHGTFTIAAGGNSHYEGEIAR